MNPGLAWEPWTLELRDGTSAEAESATLEVREDRRGGEGTIPLRLVRLRSRRSGAPPTVFLAGGPGDSAIQWLRHPPFFRAFDAVRERTDLIFVDQRGCGTSGRDLRLPVPVWDAEDLTTHEAVRSALIAHARAGADRFRAAGVPLGAYTPEDSADDLRDLADALGVDRVNLWGYSYGTHLAQAALRRWPDRIQRVLLCGFEGPDHTLKLPSQIEAQLDRLDAWAAGQGFPDLKARLAAVLAEWDSRPFALPDAEGRNRGLGAGFARHLIAGWSSVSNRLTRIPLLVEAAEAGDPAPWMDAAAGWTKAMARPLTFYLKDGASGVSPARAARIAAEAPTCVLDDAANLPFMDVAAAVGARDLGEAYRRPVASRLPVVVFTGGFDGFTPTGNAREGLADLPNARLIEIPGAAHNDLLAPPGVAAAAAAFLGDGADPPRDVGSVPPPRRFQKD